MKGNIVRMKKVDTKVNTHSFEIANENIRLNEVLKQLVGEEKNWQETNGQDKLEKLQYQLEIANKKLDVIREYFNKDVNTELKYLWDKNDKFHKNKDFGDKGYGCAIQSVQAIQDHVLSIVKGE